MARRFDHLADVEALVAVVDHGSLTAAAVALSTTPSVISRAVARLETRLGSQLLRRTTRRTSLTEAGRLYVEQARAAFHLIDDAERAVQGEAGTLSGHVRLSVPTTYGHYRLPWLLRDFVQQHPQVRLEVNIANRNVDLVAEGYDLAIRLGALPDSGLVGRTLEDAGGRDAQRGGLTGLPGCTRHAADAGRSGGACLPAVRAAQQRARGAVAVPRGRR